MTTKQFTLADTDILEFTTFKNYLLTFGIGRYEIIHSRISNKVYRVEIYVNGYYSGCI